MNGIIIARNILTGLRRVSPENAAYFAEREQDFERRVLEATIGQELVGILTPPVAYDLLKSDKLYDFLGQKQYQGKPLLDRLGGWMKAAQVFRGKELACYHKEWAYFSNRYKVSCVVYIEAKPGIPPTPGHVQEVIALMKQRKIPVLFASNYFDRNQIRQVAERTGATPVIVPENTNGAPGVNTYFDLMNTWVNGLAAVFRGGAT
jgi:ABC-type Zn uptake system ZnuABC Zn-binding protein ZnuA